MARWTSRWKKKTYFEGRRPSLTIKLGKENHPDWAVLGTGLPRGKKGKKWLRGKIQSPPGGTNNSKDWSTDQVSNDGKIPRYESVPHQK